MRCRRSTGCPARSREKTPMAATTRPSSAATSATGPRSASSSDPEFRSPSRPARPIRPRGPPLHSAALCCPHIVQDRCHGVRRRAPRQKRAERDRERRNPRKPSGSRRAEWPPCRQSATSAPRSRPVGQRPHDLVSRGPSAYQPGGQGVRTPDDAWSRQPGVRGFEAGRSSS